MKSGKVSPVLYVVLGVSFGLLGFFLLLANPFGWKLPIPTLIKLPTSTPQTANTGTGEKLPEGLAEAPTPYLFLPHGKQTYNVRVGDERTSLITNIVYDPLDPKKDATQVVTATAESKESINSISLTLNTDNKTTVYPMTLTSGTKLKGIWTASFTATDTYESIYNVSFEIITELGNKSTQPMLLR